MQDSKKDTDVYSRLLDSEGEGEGECGMIWQNGIETCILSCKNRIASLCLMQDTTTDVVEIARELELEMEPKDVPDLLQTHNKI